MATLHFPSIFHKLEVTVKIREYFIQSEKDKILIPWQTYEGITTSIYSLSEVVTFLLENGVSSVLTEKFNQDRLEEYFEKHRF